MQSNGKLFLNEVTKGFLKLGCEKQSVTYGIALSLTSCLGLMGRAVFLLVVMLEVIITAESTTFVCNDAV